MALCDGSTVALNPSGSKIIGEHLESPFTMTDEMIRQINALGLYNALFKGKSGLTFLDIGANIGLVSIFASPACQKIVAVEPDRLNAGVCKLLTEPFPQVKTIEAALFSKTGMEHMSVHGKDYSRHSLVRKFEKGKDRVVRTYTFDDLLEAADIEKVDVCKVDIEGAEMFALTSDVLTAAPVEVWYIEIHGLNPIHLERNFQTMEDRMMKAELSFRRVPTGSQTTRTVIASRNRTRIQDPIPDPPIHSQR